MDQVVLTHHIQLSILKQMLSLPMARYSDIKPKNIESNLFMYHLKQLIRAGLVEKRESTYVLTPEGKRFADRATLATMKIRLQPKIVTVLCLRIQNGSWLIMRRKNQPFLNYKGFPSGKIHFGETLQQAAARELTDKAGLSGVALRLRGNVVMRFMDGETVANHISSYVFEGELPTGREVNLQNEFFHTYIGDESELFSEPCFKGHTEILELLREPSDSLFMREYEFTSDY